MKSIEIALDRFQKGGMIIVVDNEDRENEGDLIIAAEKVTHTDITFMARNGCGLICLALSGEQIDKLQLPMMSSYSQDHFGTAFTVSIDAAFGITTGISAADRALTIQLASHPEANPKQLTTPGHIFPLRAKKGGVLERPGHTEASVDLARIAGLWPAGVICEIMNPDGTMMRRPQLEEFAKTHKLPMMSIEELKAYRQHTESLAHENTWLKKVAESSLPTKYGLFKLWIVQDSFTKKEHIALIYGDVHNSKALVRIHSECLTGDILGSLKCDCGPQLHQSLEQIAQAKAGVLIYLRQEGRGIGLIPKIHAYALQDQGYDTLEANKCLGFKEDERSYEAAIAILKSLNIKAIDLLSNNPQKIKAVTEHWKNNVNRLPLIVGSNPMNEHYLSIKKQKMKHLL